MNDDRLVREVWKELPLRAVVGQRLVRAVGARGWERPRFARFRRFFERCGVPDPWDPAAGDVEIGLGEVGVAQRKTVAPHAAPPPAPGGPRTPNFPNIPRAPAAPPPDKSPPEGGKPAPRIGETRKDDTALLKQKLAESEKKKANPAHANAFKVNQPVAKLPMRPELAEGTPIPRSAAGAKPTSPSSPSRAEPPRAAPSRPAAPSPRPPSAGPARPTRMPIEPVRRPLVPDGPEEVEERPPVAARPGADRAYAGFGLGGDWDDEPPPPRAAVPSFGFDDDVPAVSVPTPGARAAEPSAESAASATDARPAAGSRVATSSSPAATPPSQPAALPASSAPRPTSPAPAASTTPPRPTSPAPAASTTPPRPTSPAPAASTTPPRPTSPAPAASTAPPHSTPPAPAASRPPTPASGAPPSATPRPPAAPPPKPGAPPPRPGRGGGGLDDLFGMGGGENTRFRMPKREEADAAKPRRPMVTPDAELGKGGIDRRPPPPKPPPVVPSSGGGPAPDFDGDGD